jgi:hypothetical protein
MTTFTTKILEIAVLPKDPTFRLDNVVYLIEYEVTGVDGKFSHAVSRKIGIGNPDPNNFTPVDKLTTEQLMQFLTNSLAPDDMRVVENEIQEAIESQKNPQKDPYVIPWAAK